MGDAGGAAGVVFEQREGAARARLWAGYRRREPGSTLLHRVVRENLETLLAAASETGRGLPRYVERELRRYLVCGVLEEGFCRVVCERCGDELLVAFSCKGRGFCPSCCGRRMSDTAAHLVDRVLPMVPYRQWVLSYPRRLRLMLARDAGAASESATILLREVFRWQRRQGRRQGLSRPRVGAVSFTQRFGSRLDLNVHHHAVVPEGVFEAGEGEGAGAVGFEELRPPRVEELEAILERVVARTLSMVRRRGLMEEEPSDALAQVQQEAMQPGLALRMEEGSSSGAGSKLSAWREGFSLEAGRHLDAHDREGLEQLCRYGLRPPLALKRLSLLADGRVALGLKRRLGDGTAAVAYTPVQFVRRLAAIVPPPRWHQTRYFGVFAPAAKLRRQVVGGERGQERRRPCSEAAHRKTEGVQLGLGLEQRLSDELGYDPLWWGPAPQPERERRLTWAQLLKRVFEAEVLVCGRCGGRRRVTAFVPDAVLAKQILEGLGMKVELVRLAKARAPPHQESMELPVDDPGVDPVYPD